MSSTKLRDPVTLVVGFHVSGVAQSKTGFVEIRPTGEWSRSLESIVGRCLSNKLQKSSLVRPVSPSSEVLLDPGKGPGKGILYMIVPVLRYTISVRLTHSVPSLLSGVRGPGPSGLKLRTETAADGHTGPDQRTLETRVKE